ncbi:hypothetical protein QC764_307170 [Podospora pseudoanserina]|uniref:C2H2-type domain-containing protein n=1 Tax=Podospora pseudoanserina TaxID=2609844 RepID=A0ABR0IE53_9PEZI|nr:hypothetical protein QC764_307170 [Podospora pseudoanserina]
MAGPGFDPNEIHNFLRTYPSSDYTGVYGYSQNPYSDGVETPRYAVSIVSGDLPDGSEFDHTNADVQSSYTAAPSVASRAYTTTSTMQSSTASVFSRWDDQSSVGRTSIASGRRSIAAPPAPTNWAQQTGELWCEFSELKGCSATFRLDDEFGWIEHHVRHLREKLPVQSRCWFCDDYPFVAESPSDLYPRFYERMQHIRLHIDFERVTSDHMRPDFHVVEHMYRQRLIPEHTYRLAMQFDELPPQLQIPGTPGAAPPSSSSSMSRPSRNLSSQHRMDEIYSQGSGYRSRR